MGVVEGYQKVDRLSKWSRVGGISIIVLARCFVQNAQCKNAQKSWLSKLRKNLVVERELRKLVVALSDALLRFSRIRKARRRT